MVDDGGNRRAFMILCLEHECTHTHDKTRILLVRGKITLKAEQTYSSKKKNFIV